MYCFPPTFLSCSKRAFVVTDPALFEMGVTKEIILRLLPLGIQPKTFTNVEPDPTLGMVERALVELRSFKPDVVIAVGGGSPMDAAKLMWLMYEHPDIKFEEVAARFMVSGSSIVAMEVWAECSVGLQLDVRSFCVPAVYHWSVVVLAIAFISCQVVALRTAVTS